MKKKLKFLSLKKTNPALWYCTEGTAIKTIGVGSPNGSFKFIRDNFLSYGSSEVIIKFFMVSLI